MTEVTQILGRIEDGDPSAAEKLLPLIYDELRKLAAVRMADERSDHTLQATALVHEAYVRLVDVDFARQQTWDNRGHFFSAAAEAMRRILVEHARRRETEKRGGEWQQKKLSDSQLISSMPNERLLLLNDAIEKLNMDEPRAAELVKLRFFTGLTMEESADVLGVSRATVFRYWAYAKSFLVCEMGDSLE